MSTKPLKNPVTLTLELDDLTWLRGFLDQERSVADVDRQDVMELHTILASRAAQSALVREQEVMTKIIDEICRTIGAPGERESIARAIDVASDSMPPVA